MTDDRTPYLGLPLPHPNNMLSEDVLRLRQALSGIDEALSSFDESLTTDMLQTLALEAAAQVQSAHKAIDTLRRGPLRQQGEIVLQNRGVISGCAVSKSSTATRNLNISLGYCFVGGQRYLVSDGVNAASVPSNTGASAATVYAYLYPLPGGQRYAMACTGLGEAVPANAIAIYRLTIPANSTDATDPYLTNVTLTDLRRIEPNWPALMDSPPEAYIVLPRRASQENLRVWIDIAASTGRCERQDVEVVSRAPNGFTLRLCSSADNVAVRWTAEDLSQF